MVTRLLFNNLMISSTYPFVAMKIVEGEAGGLVPRAIGFGIAHDITEENS